MYPHRRIRLASLRIFLIMWPFCSGTIVTGQSPEIRPPAPIPTPYYANPQVNVPSIRKFTFKHAKAADVLKILQQLAGQTDHIGLKIAVDERTNSLVFQPDDDRQTREFEETCALLDTETPSPSVSTNGVSIAIPALGPKPLTLDFSIPIVSDNSIETLQKRYNELEQQTHQLADKLKQSKSLSETERKELKTAVRKSFEARQAMQRAELADLAQRMKSMQQSIEMRDKLADKVVKRRVEDLLNPNLKWDTREPGALAQDKSSAKPTSIKEAVSAILLNAKSESAADDSKQSTRQKTEGYSSPQELLATVEQHGKSGSYEDFVKLFNDGGARDLAGSLLMLAVMQTSIEQTFGGLAEVDSDFVAFRKVLQRWLPQSVTTAQQEAMGKGLSTMMSSIGGASPDQTAMKEFVSSMRESVEGISDHRKFSIEIMQAFEKLTTRKFVYFGNADNVNEWQISPFGDRAIATLIDGSPGMPTTITLQQASGTWRISSLFNERILDSQPATTSPTSIASIPSNAKTVTRRYSVGSFVTESLFTGKGSYDTKEVYDKYETEIEQSLQDLVKTVTSACTQPPKFVQVLNSSRCLLIGHTEAGHQEIASFMNDIGISNDRIRLRVKGGDITSDEAKMLGIELTLAQRILSPEEVAKLWQVCNLDAAKRSFAEENDLMLNLVDMDETIASGTKSPFQEPRRIPLAIAARIVPGTKQIQIRLDMRGYASEKERFVMHRYHTLTDGQSVLFTIGGGCFWVVTADIVRDEIVGVNPAQSSTGPRYSGHPLAWWLDSFWANANAAKWFASVEHEVNEVQLTSAAKCILFAAGPKNQKLAVQYLFKIWTRVPILTLEKQTERAAKEANLAEICKNILASRKISVP